MISPEDKKILDVFSARVRERFPEARVWAFGSRVRGKTEWDSDFDICVVLDKVSEEDDRLIRGLAWEVGFESDRVISTVVLERANFEHGPMSESTLVANILREGIAT
jgi:uncharacterized protein